MFKRIWFGLTRQAGSMTQKVAQGVAWVGLGSAADQGLNAVQTMIMARLLLPEDFGIAALATVVVGLAGVLTQSGVNQACVQRKEIDDAVLDTAWVMEMARNLAMALFLVAVAWPVSRFYDEPRLFPALAALSTRFIMLAFRNIGVNLLVRDMNFRRHEVYQRIITLGGTLTTVLLAFLTRNFWALIYGQVVYGFMELVGSYMVHPFRPRFRFRLKIAASLFRYGSQILIGSFVGYLKGNLDTIMLGKLLGVTAVGYYRLMLTLSMFPGLILTGPIWTVMFPAFSRMQDRAAALRDAFIRALRLGMAVCLPACAGMALVAQPLVALAYGPKYLPAVPVFRVFCLLVVLRLLTSASSPLFSGIGKPILGTLGSVAATALFVPAMVLLAGRYEAVGVALARVIGEVGAVAATLWFLRSNVKVGARQLAAAAAMPAAGTLVMSALLLPFTLWQPSTHVVRLLVTSAAGAGIYVLFHLTVNSVVVQDVKVAAGHFFGRK